MEQHTQDTPSGQVGSPTPTVENHPGRVGCYKKGCRLDQCREAVLAYQRERYNRQRRRALEYLGSRCRVCGRTEEDGVTLHFHHRDPDEKATEVSKLFRCGWDTIRAEVEKCILLCEPCHHFASCASGHVSPDQFAGTEAYVEGWLAWFLLMTAPTPTSYGHNMRERAGIHRRGALTRARKRLNVRTIRSEEDEDRWLWTRPWNRPSVEEHGVEGFDAGCGCLICRTAKRASERLEYEEDKRWAQAHLGGVCSSCGEDDPARLEFHHVDPSEKEYGVASMCGSYPRDQIMKEARKCVLLCRECHAAVSLVEGHIHWGFWRGSLDAAKIRAKMRELREEDSV